MSLSCLRAMRSPFATNSIGCRRSRPTWGLTSILWPLSSALWNVALSSAAFSIPSHHFSSKNQTTIDSNNLYMSPHLIFHHLKDDVSVESTQEEARRLLRERQRNLGSAWKSKNQALAVLADIQLHGRGTQGRKWERGTGVSQNQTDGNYLAADSRYTNLVATANRSVGSGTYLAVD